MFTGIVEELGSVVAVEDRGQDARLVVRGPLVVSDAHRGDSIPEQIAQLVEIQEGLRAQFAEVGGKLLDHAQKQFLERADQRFKQAEENVQTITKKLLGNKGKRTPASFHKQLGKLMWEYCGMARNKAGLEKGIKEIAALREEYWKNVNVLDTGNVANRALSYTNQLWNMFELGEVIATSALLRDESRGAHYKPDFSLPEPKTKDPTQDPEWMSLWRARHEKWAKTTIATYSEAGPKIHYEDIPTPVLDPEPRWYA